MNPLAIKVALLALVITNAFTWHISAVYTESGWEKREAKLNGDAANRIATADKRILDGEHKRAEDINNVAALYEDQLKDKNGKLQIALNTIAANPRRLSVIASCPAPGGNPTGNTAASTGVDNGRAYLSEETTRALRAVGADIERAGYDADAMIQACQGVITADRKRGGTR